MLKIDNLYYWHNVEHSLLNGIDLTLQKGELLTILGANGRGKSTLLNCIAGLLKPKTGQILLDNCKLSEMSSKQIAQKIAYVSQHSPQTYQLGISHFADRIYMQMSGGEKQLVNLARILVQQPQLILFDEPTSALDYGNVFKTLSLIKELSLQGFTIIMTTHNPDHPMLLHSALPHSRVSILNEHGKLQTGLAPEIITEANLKALYQTDLRLVDVPALQRQICAITHL